MFLPRGRQNLEPSIIIKLYKVIDLSLFLCLKKGFMASVEKARVARKVAMARMKRFITNRGGRQ